MRTSRGLGAATAVVLVLAAIGNVTGGGESTPTPSPATPAALATATALAHVDDGAPTGPPARPASSLEATPRPTPRPTPAPTPPPFGTAPIGQTETAQVVRVVDGDTIVVDRGFGEERVRYIGVDTPETVDPGSPVEWMGPEATEANRALVRGMKVLLERDVSETDRFGRLLRYVWIADASSPGGYLLVNLALVAQGYAQVSTFPPDVRYVDLYLAAQDRARTDEAGLWGPEPTPRPTPRPTPKPTPRPARDCHPSYEGACLKIGAGDYDCAGGSGNGPNYTGTVRVVGYDEFGLDADDDGIGCE